MGHQLNRNVTFPRSPQPLWDHDRLINIFIYRSPANKFVLQVLSQSLLESAMIQDSAGRASQILRGVRCGDNSPSVTSSSNSVLVVSEWTPSLASSVSTSLMSVSTKSWFSPNCPAKEAKHERLRGIFSGSTFKKVFFKTTSHPCSCSVSAGIFHRKGSKKAVLFLEILIKSYISSLAKQRSVLQNQLGPSKCEIKETFAVESIS